MKEAERANKKMYFTGQLLECFFLREIASDPKRKRQGIGRMLVKWAQDIALKERACLATFAPYVMRNFLQGVEFWEQGGFELRMGGRPPKEALGGIRRAVWISSQFVDLRPRRFLAESVSQVVQL